MNLKLSDGRHYLSFPGPAEKMKLRRKYQWNVSFWVILISAGLGRAENLFFGTADCGVFSAVRKAKEVQIN